MSEEDKKQQTMQILKPKSNEDFRKMLNKWVMHFYETYLAEFDQEKLPKV
jgi:hypothetical protein